jgi:hypothetical protein
LRPRFVVSLGSDPVTEGFVEIRERRPSSRLVTVIEVLGPANKAAGTGRKKYLAKQLEYRRAGVNLVEIDLLRGGRWTVVAPPDKLPDDIMDAAAYRVSVWRATSPDDADFFPIGLRESLPVIPVPLRSTDEDVPLDLQPLLNRVYDLGGYDDTDYEANPKPRLSRQDASWAEKNLRAKGLLGE